MKPLSPMRSAIVAVIQVLELIIVAAVGIPAILAERMQPDLLIFGLSLLLLPIALRLLFTGQPAVPTLALCPLFLLVLLTAITVRVTPSWQHTWPELVRMLWGIALCIAVINWINPWQAAPEGDSNTRKQLTPWLIWATVAFLGVGLLLTTVGLLVMGPTHKIASLDNWLALLPKVSIDGLTGFNPNRVAGVAVLIAPLVFALMLGPLLPRHRSPTVWLSWFMTKIGVTVLTLFFCSALLLTQSRGSWLAMGCASLLILILLGRRGWILLALLAVVIVAVFSVTGPTQLLQKLTVYDVRNIDPDALIQDRNVAGRLILWQRALHGIADAPLTGMGLGAFEVVSQQPYPQVVGFEPDPDMSHVHNIILQVGIDFGLPGVIAFGALLIMIGWLLIRLVWRTRATRALHTWSLGLLGSFVAYLLYSMQDAITLGARPSIAVWFLFGLCLGAGEWALTPMAKPRQRRQPVTPLVTMSPPTMPIAEPRNDPAAKEAWELRAWAATAQTKEE